MDQLKQAPGSAKTLDRAEALNRAILTSALDCIITMDADGIVREFNPAAEQTFGYRREEAVGRELAELIIPPSLRERHREGLKRYLKTGEGPVLGKRIEITGMRADQSEILVELAITAFQIEGVPLFTAYLRDITLRKEQEKASLRLAAIIESSDDAIVSKDLDGTITSWNDAAERLFGYRAEEIVGKSILTLIPPELQHEEPGIISRIRRGERIDHYETLRQRKDGTLFDISVTVSPIKGANGEVIGASKIARDISERVRAERRRAAQYTVANLLARSWSLEQAAPGILQTIASSGKWIFAAMWLRNDGTETACCEATWHKGSPALIPFENATRDLKLKEGEGLPGRVFSSKKPVWVADVTKEGDFMRPETAVTASLRGAFAFPLWAENRVTGVVEFFSNEMVQPDEDLLHWVEAIGSQIGLFIHRRKIEEELQRQKEAAEAANAAKDRFLATLSHELRTPLNPVLIWAGGTLRDQSLEPELREGIEMVSRNVELEARLIDDLLDLTRIARGKVRLQKQLADAHEVLRHAMAILHSETASRAVAEHVDVTAQQHRLMIDPPRLQQAFWNVLRNAYKFTADQGAITIRTHNETPGMWTLEISDTGIGIEKASLGKIFDAFEQLDTQREGLGLGLAIAKAIVEMHDGAITAESEGLGNGATFRIQLPLPAA